MNTHSQEVSRGERFGFGKNWERFLQRLNEERIDEAQRSLEEMSHGISDIKRDGGCRCGPTFWIGSGVTRLKLLGPTKSMISTRQEALR